MDSLADSPPTAWLPLTPSGVAAFARASSSRLWLVQILAAMLVAGTVLWVLDARWFPVVSAAVEHLPGTGAIHGGRLECDGEPVQPLAESRFIAFAIDLQHAGQARSPSQIQIEFGQTNLRVYSVFGVAEIRYPVSLAVPFNFQELKPWWGAWAPVVLAIAALGTVSALLLSWTILATVYCVVVWLLGFFLNRDLTWRGSWLLSGAALMPGALVMVAAIAGYGLGRLDFDPIPHWLVFSLCGRVGVFNPWHNGSSQDCSLGSDYGKSVYNSRRDRNPRDFCQRGKNGSEHLSAKR